MLSSTFRLGGHNHRHTLNRVISVKKPVPSVRLRASKRARACVFSEQIILLACAITHHSYVQSIVLEPCSRLIVQNNEAIDPLRWSVDGATSTGDVVCRLFSTTLTAVVRGQSPAQHVSPKSANTSP